MAAAATVLAMQIGCHKKTPAPVTDADVAKAQEEARHEVEQARIEAKKDIKSESKIMGPDSTGAARARVTGAFDVAMAQADGDRKVALEKCLMLEAAAQQPCKDAAESDYQTAAAKAKANRASKQP
jgi:hypothetical protein